MKKYDFKDHPDHKAQLKGWAKPWIANAMSTQAMTEEDRAACREAVVGLYAAAKLPPPKHIVFVPSPIVLAFAGGFAASIWHRNKGSAATSGATRAATWDATRAATRDATEAATEAATWDATRAATWTKDLSRCYVIPTDMRALAKAIGVGDFGLRCAAETWRMWQYGNQWSGYDAYLSFFQDVAKLGIDYSAYRHWRTLTERSGPRIVHPDFCMISDRPEVLTVDDQNRPHNETGPFCRWRDGSALYSWHGARVPARWIEDRQSIDPREVIAHENVEIRAAGAAMVGWAKMLDVLKVKVIDDSGSPDVGQLIELTLPGLNEPGRFLKAQCPRNGVICEGVPRVSDIDGLPIETALHAQAWRIGDPLSDYQHPPTRT